MFNINVLAEKAQSTSQLTNSNSNVLTSLGLDWGSFGFYLICFGITFFGLYKFLFRPVSHLIESRQNQIIDNIELQKTLKTNLDDLEDQRASVRSSMNNLRIQTLEEAKTEAKILSQQILDQANSQAKSITLEAGVEAENIKINAKSEIEKEVLIMWQGIITQNLKSLQVSPETNEQVIRELLKTSIK